METTVADVDDHMEGDTASEANQESEDTRGCNPPCDIIQSSKLKLSSDLEMSLKFTDLLGDTSGMIGSDFELVFYPAYVFRCHKFMLASRSKVFHDMFMANPTMTMSEFKLEPVSEAARHNMLKFIYTGTIDEVPPYSVSHHLSLAATYKLEPMAELVQKKLTDSLDSSNCIEFLVMTLTDPLLLGLKEKAIKTIVDNLSNLVSLEEWEDLTKSEPSLTTEILRTYFMR